MTPAAVVSELVYRNYRFNRERSPQITPAQWARVFGEGAGALLEQRFTQEVRVPVMGTDTRGSRTSGDDQ
jgi:hypothetical protein